MFRKILCALLLLSLATIPLHSISEAQQVTSTLTITMQGVPVSNIVQGVFHNITVTLSQPSDDVTLIATPTTGSSGGNFTDNYSWSYSSGVWADDLYGYYIKVGSARYGNSYSFNIAVDSTCVLGPWNFFVIADGVLVGTHSKIVEVARPGITISAPTFYFKVFPYNPGYISSLNSENVNQSQSMSTTNTGNVPLTIRFSFEGMQTYGPSSSFRASNSTGTSLPGDSRTHYIDFQAQQWSPREFEVKGFISGEPQLLATPNTVSTNTTVSSTFKIIVTVARPGYSIFQMDGVVVQYKKAYNSIYKQSLSLDMYLTGNKSVYMGHRVENLAFNHFLYQNNETREDILLDLRDDVEYEIIANITCSIPPPLPTGEYFLVHFTFKLEDNTATGEFTSNIYVKTSSTTGTENETSVTASIVIILILVAVFLVIGIALFRVYTKTKEERRRELEDRIRKKKEKAKKRRRL